MTTKEKVDPQIFLEQWVVQDGKPVTARLLSLLLECHISEAHKYMSIFERDTRTREANARPFTSWVVKGILKAEPKATNASQQSTDSMEVDDDGNDRSLISEGLFLVSDDQLEEATSRFESLTFKEVYAFSPVLSKKSTQAHKVAAISQLTTIQHELHSKKEYTSVLERTDQGAALGTIRSSDSRKHMSKTSTFEPQAGPSRAAPPSKSPPQVKKEAIAPKVEKKSESKKQVAPAKANTAKTNANAKSKRKLVESDEEDDADETRRPANDDDDDEKEFDEGPIGYSDDKKELKASDKAKTKAKSNGKRADASDQALTEEEKKRKRKQELMDMMDEDSDGQADPPGRSSKARHEQEADPLEPLAIEISESTSTSMMKGSENENKVIKDDEANVDLKDTAKAPKKRVRKQRKVIRKEKTKDAKGYTRTQDVEAYESYSSDESDKTETKRTSTSKKKSITSKDETVPTAPALVKSSSNGQQANAAPAKKAANTNSTNFNGGGAAGGQRKLSSFFSKGK